MKGYKMNNLEQSQLYIEVAITKLDNNKKGTDTKSD